MGIVSICGWICVDATSVSAQEMRAKSNEIYLKLNEPRSRTSVPVISWLTPQQDYTHSTEMQITVQAEIQSDVPLQEVQLIIGDNISGSTLGSQKLEIPFNTLKYNLSNTIYLVDASNYVEIVVENRNGAKVSSKRIILVGEE